MKRIIICAVSLLVSAVLSAGIPGQSVLDNIIPQPQSATLAGGIFKAGGAVFKCDPAVDQKTRQAIIQFSEDLAEVCGKPGKFTETSTGKSGFIFLVDSSIKAGGYTISITPKAAVVSASDRNGFLYSIQTIKQMLPREIYSGKSAPRIKWTLPCCSISDSPRFGYRGCHLDCGRHFFSLDEVKKYLDVMAMYKLNKFHWHLTEDQGWRVEIKKYPELTKIGAYRNGTMIGKDWKSNDGIRYGGFYTQEQIKEVIAYADNLGIDVIPEIDLPGHMVAALATYPELGCGTGPYEVRTTWGIADQVLNVGKEQTMVFLENVLAEIAGLFPSEYIHIGGDECPKKEWKNSPECQAKIAELGLKDDELGTAEQHLQCYVTARMQKFLSDKGKKIIGWDEILEGKLAPGATIMSWRDTKGGIKAANLGYDVIMTPNTYCYIDYYQSKDKSGEPLAIGGYLPVEKVYSYDPHEGIPEENRKHILGAQVNLWTEYIGTDEYLEYMLLPRMIAISEVQWCQPSVKNYDRFKKSVIEHQFPILDIRGYNYCRHIAE